MLGVEYLGLSSLYIFQLYIPLYIPNPAQNPLHKNLHRVFHFNRAAIQQKNKYVAIPNYVTSLRGGGTTTKQSYMDLTKPNRFCNISYNIFDKQ